MWTSELPGAKIGVYKQIEAYIYIRLLHSNYIIFGIFLLLFSFKMFSLFSFFLRFVSLCSIFSYWSVHDRLYLMVELTEHRPNPSTTAAASPVIASKTKEERHIYFQHSSFLKLIC